VSTNEEINDLLHALVGHNLALYKRSPEFKAWVQLQANSIMAQRDILVQAFHAQLADNDRRYIEALTDTRPRLIHNRATWVQEVTGLPIMDQDYVFDPNDGQ